MTTRLDRSAPLRTRVRSAIEAAWAQAIADGTLPPLDEGERPAVEIERPANPEHGDFASNLAMKLARPYRKRPIDIATALADALTRVAPESGSPIAHAEVAMPGFLNIRLTDRSLEEAIAAVLADPAAWGQVAPIRPRAVNVEFVSANPTGPLTVGNARGAFIGDLLGRVLAAGGQTVTREYYFNDSGGQLTNLGASVVAIRRGEQIPEDGYHGAYVAGLAAAVPDDVWQAANADGSDPAEAIGHWAALRVREGIEASLEELGVHFDVWKSEGSLHAEGWVDRAIERLRAGGHVYEQDGALWFRSTAFGDDKDRVIIRSDGRPTYFAADIGYVTEKFSRGFDHLIYIWGVDHHGTVARNRGAAEAMGYPREAVQMHLYEWVHFVRPWTPADGDDAEVRDVGGRKMTVIGMSKRAGEFITLDELLAQVGVDAARWFFASRANTSVIDFDIGRMRELRELVDRRRNRDDGDGAEPAKAVDLGVYYVQYAHARIASILRKATAVGLEPASDVVGGLGGAAEAALARAVVRLPEVVEDAVWAEETHGITAYASALATQFHAFYRDARVIDVDEPLRSGHRLALAAATKTTLANALALLGISAPESM